MAWLGAHFICFLLSLQYNGYLTRVYGARCLPGQGPADLGKDFKITGYPKTLDKKIADRLFQRTVTLGMASSATFTVLLKEESSLTLMGLTVIAQGGDSVLLTIEGKENAKVKVKFSNDKAYFKLTDRGMKKVSLMKIHIKPEKGQNLQLRRISLVLCKAINECEENPCVHGSCKDLKEGYTCECQAGWTGNKCDVNRDDCRPNPCLNRGECRDEVNGYSCICKPGYRGVNCGTDINDCAKDPCSHGVCKDQVNGYRCDCDPGWEGKNCGRNIDECSPNPCKNRARCMDRIPGFKCKCKPGWTGRLCDRNIDECASNPCVRGQCVDRVGGYSCRCDPGWGGTNCNRNIDDCASSPCGKRGICTDKVNGYECFCKKGWAGKQCKIKAPTDVRCPRDYMRFDITNANADFFDLKIHPNHREQDPVWGLMDAEFDDGKDAFLRLMDNDKYSIQPKKTKLPGAVLYVGQLCMRTFVVDKATVQYSIKGSQSDPTIFQLYPVRGPDWFRLSCTPHVARFQRVDSILIQYAHQPPNFNMKELFIEACIPIGII